MWQRRRAQLQGFVLNSTAAPQACAVVLTVKVELVLGQTVALSQMAPSVLTAMHTLFSVASGLL